MDYETLGKMVWSYFRRHAGSRVYRAIHEGVLAPPADHACADCGVVAEAFDHRDYLRSLYVWPVCFACNLRRGPAAMPDRHAIENVLLLGLRELEDAEDAEIAELAESYLSEMRGCVGGSDSQPDALPQMLGESYGDHGRTEEGRLAQGEAAEGGASVH